MFNVGDKVEMHNPGEWGRAWLGMPGEIKRGVDDYGVVVVVFDGIPRTYNVFTKRLRVILPMTPLEAAIAEYIQRERANV